MYDCSSGSQKSGIGCTGLHWSALIRLILPCRLQRVSFLAFPSFWRPPLFLGSMPGITLTSVSKVSLLLSNSDCQRPPTRTFELTGNPTGKSRMIFQFQDLYCNHHKVPGITEVISSEVRELEMCISWVGEALFNLCCK